MPADYITKQESAAMLRRFGEAMRHPYPNSMAELVHGKDTAAATGRSTSDGGSDAEGRRGQNDVAADVATVAAGGVFGDYRDSADRAVGEVVAPPPPPADARTFAQLRARAQQNPGYWLERAALAIMGLQGELDEACREPAPPAAAPVADGLPEVPQLSPIDTGTKAYTGWVIRPAYDALRAAFEAREAVLVQRIRQLEESK